MGIDDSTGSVEAPETEKAGLTRREALRRGVAFSGLIWVPPVISSMQLSPSSAQATSPTTTTTGSTTTSSSTTTTSTTTTTTTPTTTTTAPGKDISYIGLHVDCGEGAGSVAYTIKYEGCSGSNCFETEPGNFPKCPGFEVDGQKEDGDDLGFTASGPNANGQVTIHVPAGCVVTESVVKGGQCCEAGPTGGGSLVFSKPDC